MKKNSLVDKLTIYISFIIAAVILIIAVVLSITLNNYIFKATRQDLEKDISAISPKVKSYIRLNGEYNLEDLQKSADFVGEMTGAKIVITDNLGYVYLVSSNEDEKMKYSNINLSDEDMDKLKKGDYLEIKDTNLSNINYTYIEPIIDNDYFAGIISINISINDVMNFYISIWKVSAFLIIGLILLIVIVNRMLIKKFVTNPIEKINLSAQRFSKGEFQQRVNIDSKDEIGQLSHSFNVMASSLEEADRNRRIFISNVSHELRSPITSMKGFVSGILDGIIPKDKENYYLNIVYDEINRLSRLVTDLLDISSLEDNDVILNKVEIDINILIELCLMKLENRIVENDLHVEVIVEKKHQFVYADRDKIIQVLINLLDNSIKYGDKGGYIKIKIEEKGAKVHVSIRNKGPQLSEEEKVKIWDRFYKADKSRTKKDSTGLGLPIVRLILAKHGEDIWVENKEDGVIFTFTLAKLK